MRISFTGKEKERSFKIYTKEKKEMKRTKKVTKVGQRFLCGVVAMILLVGNLGFTSFAADVEKSTQNEYAEEGIEVLEATIVEDVDLPSEINPYTMLTNCVIGISGDDKGMHIGISTGVVGTGSVIGVKDVKVQKKNWLGLWTTVAVCDGGESYNRGTMAIDILYANAERGATYRILCVHYGDVDGYTETENNSGAFVFDF